MVMEHGIICRACIDADPNATKEGTERRAAITFDSSDDYLNHRAKEHGDCVVCGAPKVKNDEGEEIFGCQHEQIPRRSRKVRLAIAKGELDSAATRLAKE